MTPHGRLIVGDNLLVLERLLPTLGGQVQCVWIDPPYNTGDRSRPYQDAWSSGAWDAMMAPRLERIRELLTPEGSLFVHLSDDEAAPLEVRLRALFGDDAVLNRVTVRARAPSAFSTVNRGLFKAAETLLWVARDRARVRCLPVRVARAPDRAYRLWLDNPDDPPERWRLLPLRQVAPEVGRADQLRVEHPEQVWRLAPVHPTRAGVAVREAAASSRAAPARVVQVERAGRDPVLLLRGQQLVCYARQVTVVDGVRTPTQPLTDIWTDISWEGIAGEGGVRLRQGKKPERLVRRCLQLSTHPGDLVLDAFGGSGTTAAVAHKMGRPWVLVERDPALAALAEERLRRVVQGRDPTGITGVEGWRGGGDFVVER